jgi:hypothetical protein
MNRGRLWIVAAIACAGCADTGQEQVQVPLFVAGSDVSEPLIAAGNVLVTIERADLAFGPLYLCAGATAGDLCDTARLEWLGTTIVDTTNANPKRAGELRGVTGAVRSWMYDLAISSQLTRSQPFVLDAARDLGNASFVLAGRANVDGVEIPFSASVPVQQTDATEFGVPVVRKSTSDAFFRDVTPREPGLVLRFDPGPWLRGIDFRPYVAHDACASGGPTVACAGATESTCDDTGVELSSRDCGELGQVCLPGRGCAKELAFAADSEAFRSLRNALVSGARPTFTWDYLP